MGDINSKYQIWWKVGQEESFHSGYDDKPSAEYKVKETNDKAIELGIKARYILKEALPPAVGAPPVVGPTPPPLLP